eukprot:scaffold8005_cov275-Amphora_coffeaeformis.AAC.25
MWCAERTAIRTAIWHYLLYPPLLLPWSQHFFWCPNSQPTVTLTHLSDNVIFDWNVLGLLRTQLGFAHQIQFGGV